ncbi:uncharacterized protein [Ptychodera flava]|uniref:uncharacterized protein n=1 Tax=Ptychodera flava TaxID=63121 RepID=UPI003969C51E
MYIQDDRLTLDLQDRAQRLLEKSDSLSEPRVSSEGLGSTSATTSTYQDPGSSQVYHSIQDKENVPRYSIAQGQSYRPRAKLAPEDDILYQWRLRRKLEVARQQSVDPTRPILGSGRRSPPVKLSPQKSKDWTADDDVDTKLSEFRQRMAQQRDLAGIHLANRQPVKTHGKDPEMENKGIDPIPQSIATQTSPREDQTTISDQQNEHRVESTASEQRHDSPPTRLYRTPVKQKVSEHSQPPIASPHIHHYDESGDENEVTPHLHLMCDLLPCPHQVTGEGSTQITLSPPRSRKAALEKPTASTSREGLKFTEHASPSKASKQLDFEDRGEDEGKYISGDTQTQGTEKMKKTKLPTGRDVQATTSTPKTVPGSPISTAIGQVVGSRLFTSPHKSEHSSPRSSMDSLPTMQSTQRQVEDDTVVMSSSESDEDTEDDDLLKLLHRKRTHYEDQLKRIDQLLAEKLQTN